MKETIFKVGDKVFDIRFGWGEVIKIDCNYVSVKFDEKYSIIQEYVKNKEELLSFTEYNLKNFSQKRPINYENYIGEWGKFWDNENTENFVVSKLQKFKKNSFKDTEDWGWFDNFKPFTEEQIKILGLE